MTAASVDPVGDRVIAQPSGLAPYVMALQASALFADQTYQRDLDMARVRSMAAQFDPRLLGVLEVSDRGDETFAVLDGQHRLQTVLLAHPDQGDAFVVCQVYSGLSVEAEARLFHQINKQRKPLTWWHEWRARRAAGDEQVAAVDRVAGEFGLEVNPAPREGSLRAVGALQRIMTELGGPDTLRWVFTVAFSAWGRTADAYTGPMLFGLAMIFTNYDCTDDGELDVERLIRALSEVPPQQIRARSVILREAVRAELPRLHAQVIIGGYNDQRGRKVQPFLERAPKGTKIAIRHHQQRPSSVAPKPDTAPADPAVPSLTDEWNKVLADAHTALGEATPPAAARARRVPPAPAPLGDSTRLDGLIAPTPAMTPAGLCTCGHGGMRHPGGEICSLDVNCGCQGFEAVS